MEKISEQIDRLADLNPCIRFIVDNYDVLCFAHPDKTVLVIGAQVVRTFTSMTQAMMYTRAVDLYNIPYAMKHCDGSDVYNDLVYSVSCQMPS